MAACFLGKVLNLACVRLLPHHASVAAPPPRYTMLVCAPFTIGSYPLLLTLLRGQSNRCRRLKVVSLANCSNVDDAALEGMLSRCSRLQSVNLNGCGKLTTKTLRRMAESARVRCVAGRTCQVM